jgi:hypothetical protein
MGDEHPMNPVERPFSLNGRVALATGCGAGVGAAILLASDVFPFVNGHNFNVDGGLTSSI